MRQRLRSGMAAEGERRNLEGKGEMGMHTLNLVTDAWLPVLTRSGATRTVRAAEIADPDIVDVSAPSAALSIAGIEFLIGLLSTAAAPEDEEHMAVVVGCPTERGRSAGAVLALRVCLQREWRGAALLPGRNRRG